MNAFLRLVRLLKANDPAPERDLTALQSRILSSARATPQDEPEPRPERRSFAAGYLYNPRYSWAPTATLGLLLLALGLWIGPSIKETTTQIAVAQTGQTHKEQQISMMAMASPWEGWINEGE